MRSLHFFFFFHNLTFAGVSPDASVETLPSVEGREYEVRLEEEWGARAVAALGEPLPLAQELKVRLGAAVNAALAVRRGGGDGGGGGAASWPVDGTFNSKEEGEREGGTEGEVVLFLACLCRGLETTFIVRVPEILGR